ncbi:hypothetical protein HEDGEROW_83 [Mycobacterium phage Hedgerow]|uniref:Uncharacterized protein n=1 Tax=Mycobacterium phage Hedgerow TaxID=1089123 RepID=G8I3M1_9CAUD|nr:hypothetical protein HEDGEROW_83 [Mycobacterium phage Hedgerow]
MSTTSGAVILRIAFPATGHVRTTEHATIVGARRALVGFVTGQGLARRGNGMAGILFRGETPEAHYTITDTRSA